MALFMGVARRDGNQLELQRDWLLMRWGQGQGQSHPVNWVSEGCWPATSWLHADTCTRLWVLLPSCTEPVNCYPVS